jgi:hypothetical protein
MVHLFIGEFRGTHLIEDKAAALSECSSVEGMRRFGHCATFREFSMLYGKVARKILRKVPDLSS